MLSWPVTAHSVEDLVETLREKIALQKTVHRNVKLDWPLLRKFYLSHAYYPVWFDHHGRLPRTEQLLQVLRNAENEGLDPEDYHLPLIENLWQNQILEQTVGLELLLTDSLIRYSVHVYAGRSPPNSDDRFWRINPPEINGVDLAHSVLAADRFDAALAELPPPHTGYQGLRNALLHYRHLVEQGGWPSLPPGPIIKRGQQNTRVSTLRKRLSIESHLLVDPNEQDSRLFNTAVELAVRRFQEYYGLDVTGMVDRTTRLAMNTPIAERVQQIKLNMERWRWLPRNLGTRYIMVNTAGYELTAFDGRKARLNMRIIAGTQQRATPVLNGMMNTVVLNPAWYVPWRILVEDMIPKQLQNPNYFDSKNITIFDTGNGIPEVVESIDIDWSEIDGRDFPYVLRQNPGPHNSLGRIKFSFNNAYGLYLHDTPNQHLFKHARRAFSSGCIRVEHPLQLAEYLLASNNGWSSEKIAAAVASGETMTIQVAKQMPIYLLYFTAWAGTDSAAHFRSDTYKQDQHQAKRY